MRAAGAFAVLAAALSLAGPAQAARRVMALDSCADQYVLALSPREAIVGLSSRADDRDSFMREKARGLPERRASTEAVLAARPEVVVRYWGGDARLPGALERRGIAVVRIEEATDFAGVRDNVRRVAAALDRHAAGEALVADMDAKLAAAKGAWGGISALYITPSGFTAGKGTMIEAMLEAAGLRGMAGPSFALVPLERLVLDPPKAFVFGFFDQFANAMVRWGAGRHGVLQRATQGRVIARVPGAMLGCPGWFQADGAAMLAQARR